MKIKDINMDDLREVVKTLAKNHRCNNCAFKDFSQCCTEKNEHKRCIRSEKYWVNHLSNVDRKEFDATIELVLSGKYEY